MVQSVQIDMRGTSFFKNQAFSNASVSNDVLQKKKALQDFLENIHLFKIRNGFVKFKL